MNQPTTTPAQDQGALAYLDRVISEREKSAQEACDGGEGRWHSGWREDYFACPDDDPEDGESIGAGVSDERDSTVVYDEGRPSKAQSIHIALNDPDSVLRRCAADRKMIGLMVTETSETGGQPLASRLLRHLAEGYGWTEDGR